MTSPIPAAATADSRLPICVYLASRHGANPSYTEETRRLGAALAAAGCDLVYGGGSVGLMGEVADAVLAGGGAVTGVITEHLYNLEVGHQQVTELIVVPDMPTRKRAMFERAEGFVIAPGGVGTMEELFEVWCWAALGLHPKTLGMLNCDGYYDHLLAFMQRSVDDGLMSQHTLDLLVVDDDPDRLVERIVAGSRRETSAA
ncbi:MAG TPA: TIGR00730 family Rossman fold protein [Microthrixaceae bacterium]|nr:TIGR00730 family Rossman fold protein [Microthrixaceae bacterium]